MADALAPVERLLEEFSEARARTVELRQGRSEERIHAANLRRTDGRGFAETIRRSACGRLTCARRAVTSWCGIPLCGRCAAVIEHELEERR